MYYNEIKLFKTYKHELSTWNSFKASIRQKYKYFYFHSMIIQIQILFIYSLRNVIKYCLFNKCTLNNFDYLESNHKRVLEKSILFLLYKSSY